MQKRKLGKSNLEVSAVGLGCMGMSVLISRACRRECFAPNTLSPSLPAISGYPEAYNDAFMLFDLHVLEISKFFGDRRDAEKLEIYSSLRR